MSEDFSLPSDLARAMIAGALEPDVPPHQPSSNWEPPTVEALNKILPQYQITQRLGRGGMGAVYQGRQESLDRFVAIKILPTRLAQGPAFVARFQREAKILATLNHPSIITIYDAGQTADGQLYFVMEYVDGTDLSRLQRQPEFSQKDALSLTSQICDALQYAHSRGVLHRDIKPENVMITQAGQVKLADFGLARPMGQQSRDRLTGSQVVMGTPVYMAPEQRVDPDSVDQRADLYALGVMLYEMLTGELPLPVGKWDPPSRVAAVDSRLDHVIQRALQRQPSLRYSHATEIKSDLDAIRAGDLAGFGSWTEGSPFRGLLVFDSQHARIFFGRQQATEAVIQQLHQNHQAGCGFTLIVGSSGVGKSSLARAGVLPRLQQANEIGPDFRRLAEFQPKSAANSQNLLRALAEALLVDKALPELAYFDLTETSLARALAESPVRVVSYILQALADIEPMDADFGALEEPARVGLLLLVDQLEEIFTLPWLSDADRKAFCSALKHLAQTGLVLIVATLRSDFFPQCETLPDLMDLKAGLGQYHLDPPREFEMAHIVRWSAHSGGLRFEEKSGERLDDLIIRDAADNPHSLPLLSFALDALYRARSKEGVLLLSEYEALGGLVGGLSQQAEKAYQEFAAQFPSQAETTFDALCHPLITQKSPQDAPTRNWALLSELPPDDAAQALVRHFVEARLLTIDGDRIAFAHEAVLTAWTRSKSWLEKNQDFLQIRARVDSRMQEGSPLLLGDPMLELAKAQLLANPNGFRAAQQQWINQSINTAETLTRQTTRRRRIAFAALSCLTLVAIGAAAWAMKRERDSEAAKLSAETNARRAEASEADTRGQLVAASGSEINQADQLLSEADAADTKTAIGCSLLRQKTEDALLHLAKAIEFFPENRLAREKFGWVIANRRDALRAKPLLALKTETPIKAAIFSPDGRRIFTVSENSAEIWDATTGKLASTHKLEGTNESSPDSEFLSLGGIRPARQFGPKLSFSPDGKRFAEIRSDDITEVWDVATGMTVANLTGEIPVHSVAFSPDGKLIVTASEKAIQTWDSADGKPLVTIKAESAVDAAIFSPDGAWILARSGQTAQVRGAADGKLKTRLVHGNPVESAAFSPDGTNILTTSSDNAQLWDSSNGKLIRTFAVAKSFIRSASYSPDGGRILTTSWNDSTQVWDARTGESLVRLEHVEKHDRSAFSPDGTRLITVSRDNIQVWDAATGNPITTLPNENFASFNPGGTRIVTTYNNTAKVWDAGAIKSRITLNHEQPVESATWSPNGNRLVTTSEYSAVKVWESATGKSLNILQNQGRFGSISANGELVATVFNDNTARVWDTLTGKSLATLKHDADVNTVTLCADGTRIVTTSGNTAQVWDPLTGKLLTSLKHDRPVTSAACNADCTKIVTTTSSEAENSTNPYSPNSDNAQLWDVITGQMVATLKHEEPVKTATFSPGGTRILTTSGATAQVWDSSNGQSILIIKDKFGVAVDSATFSPDGRRILTTFYSMAQLWDASTGQLLTILRHKNSVDFAAFSPDSSHIITTSDSTGEVWDALTGKSVVTLSHQGPVKFAAFSPDGRRIATSSEDITQVWDTATGRLLGQDTDISPTVYTEVSQYFADRLLSREDEIRALTHKERVAVDARISEIAQSGSLMGHIVHWLVTPEPEPRMLPDAPTTSKDRLNALISNVDKESLQEARVLAPAHPLVLIGLADEICAKRPLDSAKVVEPVDPRQVVWLKDFALRHMPDDAALWTNAASMLNDQDDLERAQQAINKVDTLNPKAFESDQTLAAMKATLWSKKSKTKIGHGKAVEAISDYEELQQKCPLINKMTDTTIGTLTLAYCAAGRSSEVLALHWLQWEPEVSAVRHASGSDKTELGALETKLKQAIREGLHDKGFTKEATVLYEALAAKFESELTEQPENWRWPLLAAWAYNRHAEAVEEEIGGAAEALKLYEQALRARQKALKLLPGDSMINALIVSSNHHVQEGRLRVAVAAGFVEFAQNEIRAVLTDKNPSKAVAGYFRTLMSVLESEGAIPRVSETVEKWLEKIERLAKEDEATTAKDWQIAKAEGWHLLAVSSMKDRLWTKAIQAARAYREYADTNLAAKPNGPEMMDDSIKAVELLALALTGAGDLSGAMQAWTDAYALWDKVKNDFRFTHQAFIQRSLAELAKKQGKLGQCLACLRKSVNLEQQTLRQLPNWERRYWVLALSEAALAEALQEYGFEASEIRQHTEQAHRNWNLFRGQPTTATANERRKDRIEEAWLSKVLETVEANLHRQSSATP